MKKKIRTAVIGVVNMGKNHARIYSKISDFIAVSDTQPKLGKKIADKYRVNYYENYKKMLQQENIEAVSVVVPTKLHKNVVLDCLERRIPTLVEKPIAENIKDAKLVLRKAKSKKTFLMVGHIERFNPAVKKLKEIVDEGKLGRIISLLAIRVGIAPPKEPNSDVALDLGIHDVDIFNYILNGYPIRKKVVRGKLFRDNLADSSGILLEYPLATGYIQTNWITPIKMRKLYVTGSKGFIELDYVSQKLIMYNKIIVSKAYGDYYDFVKLSNLSKKTVYVSRKEPLKEELLFFLGNIKKDKHALAEDAINALDIVRD